MATSLEIFHRYRQAHPPAEGFSLRDLQEIVSFVLGMSSEDLFLNHKVEFSFEKKKILEALLERKSQGEPLAYILGSVSFYGCKIFVDRSVLIPRMETEILLEKTLARVARQPIHCVYDLCSGSGCLGIAFKKQHPKCRVYLADISQEALSVASRNA
ncbi:MAG: peptide chain release factor N(5)-glutamine methyltransferase, partial [Chlamydiae bacterium]|nr:peptide chain release factor N(5)-glutamine methyltransferase [Chlamydiota bacterium]